MNTKSNVPAGEDSPASPCSALSAAYERYIDMLVAELNEVVPLAAAHGWKTSRKEAGENARAEIEELKNGGCPPDCGHSEAEHLAFDEGVATGRARGIDVENPYDDASLADAWATGHSVGAQEYQPNDKVRDAG